MTLTTLLLFASVPTHAQPVYTLTGPRPALWSAYLGITDIPIPQLLEAISGCPQEVGDEGMPIVTSLQVDAATLEPGDFVVLLESGATAVPTCATLAPADDPDELRTILISGPLGQDDDRPVGVRVAGTLDALDGQSFQGQTTGVTWFEEGPSLVLVESQPAAGTCTGSEQLLLTFQGGVTGPFGRELDDRDLGGFELEDGAGATFEPVDLDDLDDGDNHVVLCVPTGAPVARVSVDAATVFDPTNNPNPSTTRRVARR